MKNTDWLDPLNRMIWQKAFKAKDEVVTLRDGRKFTIEYYRGFVYVKPARGHGFAPAGYFNLKAALDKLWITGEIVA